MKLTDAETETNNHDDSVEVVTNEAVETVVAPTQTATEVVQPTTVAHPHPQFAGKSREEVAAIKIQTAFRGYLV